MKLDSLSLPTPLYFGALNETLGRIVAKTKGCELTYDPRTGVVSIFKGDRASLLLPSGAIADISDDQGETDAGAEPAAGQGPRRGRPPKGAPPVQT
jgi:hypothetical protein